MGNCNCLRKDFDPTQFDFKFNEKFNDSDTTGFNSMKSSLQNTSKPFILNPFTISKSPIPEAAQESEIASLKLPDYASESSIGSWRHHGSPLI